MKEKYTVITGACGGLGQSFVKLLAEAGENLLLTGTSEKKLQDLTKKYAEALKNIKIKTFVLNLASAEQRKVNV